MKLSTLKSEADIKSEPNALDIDVLEKIGPAISKNLTAVDTLLKLIPGSADVRQRFEDFKSALASKVRLQSNVLEDVVHRYDKDNPMDNSEILILGGAGRYSMKGVKVKAARECQELADELVSDVPDYKSLSAHCKQTANTLDTLVAAISELEKMNVQEPVKEEVVEVESSDAPGIPDLQAMFESLEPELGDAAWIAISRKLTAEGFAKDDIIKAIDATIIAQKK